MNVASSNSDPDSICGRQQQATGTGGTPNSSSKFAQILLELKREEKSDQSNSSLNREVDPTIRKHDALYNFDEALKTDKSNCYKSQGNSFLSAFVAASNSFSAGDDDDELVYQVWKVLNYYILNAIITLKVESDNENAYQDSSVMFTALNKLESTEMCNCKKSRCLKL